MLTVTLVALGVLVWCLAFAATNSYRSSGPTAEAGPAAFIAIAVATSLSLYVLVQGSLWYLLGATVVGALWGWVYRTRIGTISKL